MKLTEMTSVNRMNLSKQALVTAAGAWGWLKSSLCKRHAGRACVTLANPESSRWPTPTIRFQVVVLGEGGPICSDRPDSSVARTPGLP